MTVSLEFECVSLVFASSNSQFNCSEEYAARHFFMVFLPVKGPPTPQKLESIFSTFFATLNSAVIDTVLGRKCPHRLSSEKRLLVAVQSHLRVSLHAWWLPRRFESASKLWRRCSTPQHGTVMFRHPFTHTGTCMYISIRKEIKATDTLT